MKNAAKFMIILMSAALVQACENGEGSQPVDYGIPFVKSVDESSNSRLNSFHNTDTSDGAGGSKLQRDDRHITDKERKLLKELAAQRKKESTD